MQVEFSTNPSEPEEAALSVSQLNSKIRNALQTEFGSVWVTGEISDLSRPQSGHIYLSLKDEQSQLRSVLWRSTANRLPFELEDGMQVVCEGNVDVYPPRGSYQLIIRRVEPLGVGALQLALLQLREKLQAEGLFDASKKKVLPRFPRRVAVVTSPTGAAVHDFLEVIDRRWPQLHVTVVPTRVQGAEATDEIVDAIAKAQRLRPDVLVVTRGGGSLEDLWCFNEERIVRAIDGCEVPVVSAIGHEIDVTLCDLVADMRALTPTEAAERLTPDRNEVQQLCAGLARRMQAAIGNRLELQRSRLRTIESHPFFMRPFQNIQDRSRILDELQLRLDRSIDVVSNRITEKLSSLAGKLESLSPLNVLSRGYSVTQNPDGMIVRSHEDVNIGDELVTRIHDGRFRSRVLSVQEQPNHQTSENPPKNQ